MQASTSVPAAIAFRFPAAAVMRGAGDMPSIGCIRRSFSRGDGIFAEGEKAEFFYRVISGTVRVCRILSDGRRQIDAFHLGGDIFGLESGHEHRFTAEAVDCVIVEAYRRSYISSALRSDPAFGDRLVAAMLTNLERAQEHVVLLGRKTAQERVATFLVDLARRTGKTGSVDLAMQRTDIADHLGLTIETVSRTLTQMVRDSLIELASAGRTVVLSDRAGLLRLAA